MYQPPSPILNPVPPHFPLIPPAFHYTPSPPQAIPLHANIPVANNFNPLPPSPPAQFISSTNICVPQFFHPPPPPKWYQSQHFVPITHAAPAPPNPNIWRFPPISSNAVPLVRTTANLYTVQPAPFINPHIAKSLLSSHVQAAAGPQNYVTLDFMQANPLNSSTGTDPPLSLRSFHQRMELPFQTRCVGVARRMPHLWLLLWTPRI